PAGRGRKLTPSPVKNYAVENGLTVLQPSNLKSEEFIEQLQNLQIDLQIVVAFRMLPESVWNMPEKGTFNIHGSLLPQYRGAAPINWAIINGETKTGVTSFFLEHIIDTGSIINSKEISIGDNDNVEDIHDKLMFLGAELTLETISAIETGNIKTRSQKDFIDKNSPLKNAPKIFKQDCRIDWSNNINDIHNFIRGLSPYPGAFTEIVNSDGKTVYIKIFKATKIYSFDKYINTSILSDNKTFFRIAVKGGLIEIDEIQMKGKKRMDIQSFLRGFDLDNTWSLKA
ncbi:MAG: methionyl-tRNA formyltransferase, partial [Bacteroidota bacterium]|nr:methionyl-tRNA formyltransferase [Bacteroidota bacterium]